MISGTYLEAGQWYQNSFFCENPTLLSLFKKFDSDKHALLSNQPIEITRK